MKLAPPTPGGLEVVFSNPILHGSTLLKQGLWKGIFWYIMDRLFIWRSGVMKVSRHAKLLYVLGTCRIFTLFFVRAYSRGVTFRPVDHVRPLYTHIWLHAIHRVSRWLRHWTHPWPILACWLYQLPGPSFVDPFRYWAPLFFGGCVFTPFSASSLRFLGEMNPNLTQPEELLGEECEIRSNSLSK